ncbi:MAG: epoxyqueuosine reductase [Desulfobacterales bacterium]|nr:epoxyqueuosine reductase [Desulfobacterales bacterium]
MNDKTTGRDIEAILEDFISRDPANTLKNEVNEKAFDKPLVGFASGDDPIFEEYKDHVGPFYMTPWEIFALTYNDLEIKPDELTVISYILPQTTATKKDNRKENFYPSERWARARIFGEETNTALRRHIVESLKAKSIRAVAPALTPQFNVRISPEYGFSSTWSERHAAYAAGLGTFGLCDGLITPLGKAMRTGSVVAQMHIPATSRPYTDHRAYCLYFAEGTCKKCISRCPAGAISESGKNKQICKDHLFPVTSSYVKQNFGFDGYGCGLCQTGVPCESGIPPGKNGRSDS